VLRELGVAGEDVLVVARPPAHEALYHRFENELFDDLLAHLSSQPRVKTVLLPRTDAQRAEYEAQKLSNIIMPVKPWTVLTLSPPQTWLSAPAAR